MPKELMMVGLLAVDKEGRYIPALRLFGRLGFEDMTWHLAHVQSPFAQISYPFAPVDDLSEALVEDRQNGELILEKAADEACGYKIVTRTHLMEGPIAASIVQLADDLKADLVAVGSRSSGALSSALLGSVGRALAIGSRKSLLIGRGEVAESGPIDAIFATDFSYYAHRALDHLIEMRPKGLRTIRLLTAYELGSKKEGTQLHDEAKKEGLSVNEKLRAMSEIAVSKLRAAGFEAHYDMKPGYVREAIHRSMQEHRTDLLILGAQGHGFFERMVLGSVALQQVVSEPHPVLVIRP